VSAIQLQRKTFYADVLQVIEQAADGRHGIDIEVTESLIMYDIEDNIRKLNEVRNHNVHIAVDDFGTGYSSLSYIAKLPIDVLKIDRSFIIKMSESEVDLAIVSAIITLAHSLNLRVVAEGVETEQQAQILRSLNCDEAQGYLFCRPLPFDELVKRLTMTDDMVVLKESVQNHTNPPSPTIDK
jgi:EAL domain-containing protein (putative c-di-GMP-specific phosphodiesterase class I)